MTDDVPRKNSRDEATGQIVPSFSDLVVVVPEHDDPRRLLIEQVPPWVAAWVGKVPREIEGKPVETIFGGVVDALPAVAEDVLRNGQAVEDYCVEFTDSSGAARAAVLSAQRVEAYQSAADGESASAAGEPGPAVLIRLRDLSESVRAHRLSQGVGMFHGIIGRSKMMLEVFHKIEVYGPTEASVVISGETGTGKELVARALHERSDRSGNAFVAVNCTALSEELFESELFGHERGAFTGAVRSHRGRFERADKGTLFLDEIGDMPPRTQAKLLRVLEQGAFERVGGERETPVDVRILAATNISLEQAVGLRRFRADLYHRLSVFRIHVPPLRDRPGDMPLLVEHYLEILNRRYGRQVKRLTPDAMRLLTEYHWPGNVRELRNVLERVHVETPGAVIGHNAFSEWIRERDYMSAGAWNLEQLEHRRAASPVIVLPAGQDEFAGPAQPGSPGEIRGLPRLGEPFALHPVPDGEAHPLVPVRNPRADPAGGTIDAVYSVSRPVSRKPKAIDEAMIRRAFADARGNITEAARRLGVHKATLYRRLKALGLDRKDLETASSPGAESDEATGPEAAPDPEPRS